MDSVSLTRLERYVTWLAFCVLVSCLGWSTGARAAGTVSAASGTITGQRANDFNGTQRDYATIGAWCAADLEVEKAFYTSYYNQTYYRTNAATSTYTTTGTHGCSVHVEVWNAPAWGNNLYQAYDHSYTTADVSMAASGCPTNSTGTTTCTCNSGFVPGGSPYGSACVAAAATCASFAAGIASTYQFKLGAPPSGLAFCDGSTSCQLSATMSAPDAAGSYWVWGPYTSTGSDCTPSAAGTTPSASAPAASVPSGTPTCPVGQVPGTVNGNTICVTPGSVTTATPSTTTAPSGAASAPSTTTGTGAGGSVTVPPGGSSTQITTCSGASCSTTTTIKDSTGSTVGVVNSSKPMGTFCEENPSVSICKISSASNSCATGTASVSCDGDAIQCAILRDQAATNCALMSKTTPESAVYTAAAALNGANPASHPINSATDVGLNLSSRLSTTPLFGTAGQCPQDVAIHVWDRTVAFPFSSLCPYLNLLGAAFMAACFLAAGFIVFGKNS